MYSKKNSAKAILFSFAVLLGLTSITSASAAEKIVNVQPVSVQMSFDGTALQPPAGQYVFSYRGTVYVPVRFVANALQKQVTWDAKHTRINVSEPTAAQLAEIRKALAAAKPAAAANVSGKPVGVTPIRAAYVFNGTGKEVPEGQFSFTHQGTVYVPMRFVAEATGSQIRWDAKAKSITGTTGKKTGGTQGTGTPSGEKPGSTPADPTGQTPGGGKPTVPNSGSSSGQPGSGTGGGGNEGNGGGGNNGSGSGNESSYESITKNAEAKLEALQSKSQSVLTDLAKQYLHAADEAAKKQLLKEGQRQLNSLTTEFETIVKQAERELKAGGHSTEIIGQYREAFEREVEAGKQLAESMS